MKWILISAGLFLFCMVPCGAVAQSRPPAGLWKGTMSGPAGPVEFGIDITSEASGFSATLINATDREPFTAAQWDGKTLTLRLAHYDGTLSAALVSGTTMKGEYSRMTRNGVVHIPVMLEWVQAHAPAVPFRGPDLSGNWIIDKEAPTAMDRTIPLQLAQSRDKGEDGGAVATGILEAVSGDSGLMHGTVTGSGHSGHLHLSRFDGIHAMALDAELQPDGSLRGKIAYDTKSSVAFAATRAPDAENPKLNQQAGEVTRVRDPKEVFRFEGRDAQGRLLNHDSPEFRGKPLIVDIFGTWCPNCHDEAPVLEELYRKYRDQGLVVIGLAYEYNDDTERDLRQIGIYRQKYGITFPLLLSGTTDAGQIDKTLPQLVGFGAYPTTIFVGRDGRVQAIHAGFEGPATGDKFAQAKQMLERNTQVIVGSPPATGTP